MAEASAVLRLRVLLCLLADGEKSSVTGIAKTLGKEHYTISRMLSALEKEGLLNRNGRRLRLTESGKIQAKEYAKRIHITIDHLLYEGVNIQSARNDAYYWALYNSEDTMEVIYHAEEKCRVKYELRSKKYFDGNELCRRLKDGDYQFPFMIYREHIKNGTNISMANEGFEHPCTLSIKNGVGTLLLRGVDLTAKSASTGIAMRGHVKTVKYFDSGAYINSERNGNVFSIPAAVLNFCNIGSGMDQILHGHVCLRMQCSVGVIHMPESTAIFTVLV